jgi:hypothetical protein
VVVLLATAALVATAASGNGSQTPTSKPLDQAIYDAVSATKPTGIAARIRFTNDVFGSGALFGDTGSALLTGASGRLWVTSTGRARLELQSNAGDAQVIWDAPSVTVYDASSNTVYRATLPARPGPNTGSSPTEGLTLSAIDDLLARVGAHATISGANPTNVAAQPSYRVTLSPKQDAGLLAAADIAWDAAEGVPLEAALFARDGSSPVVRIQVTDISYEPVPTSDVALSPPADAHVVDLGSLGDSRAARPREGAPVRGLEPVQEAADFPVSAPETLGGLPRREVRLVGWANSNAALIVYGQGLGALFVVERRSDPQEAGGALEALPAVPLGGTTAHELSTRLGTILQWRQRDIDYILAGSVSTANAEAAARELQ